ncbi:MAG: SpoVA/SpoVAEb family sporulation membrane protein, partial [Candidatus Moranbacteria bacterium]|nr:SpoVA/SpoVAEb family sporulation membrane protein [Candidatus Moranbacteria bacterium]
MLWWLKKGSEMDIFLKYLIVFGVGGTVCFLAQILIIRTRMTSARILVLFELIGVFLQAIQIYEPIKNFANAGITVPIVGFGASLAKGAMDSIKEFGILGIFNGGVKAT